MEFKIERKKKIKVPEIVVCKFAGSILRLRLKHANKVCYVEPAFVLIFLEIETSFVPVHSANVL